MLEEGHGLKLFRPTLSRTSKTIPQTSITTIICCFMLINRLKFTKSSFKLARSNTASSSHYSRCKTSCTELGVAFDIFVTKSICGGFFLHVFYSAFLHTFDYFVVTINFTCGCRFRFRTHLICKMICFRCKSTLKLRFFKIILFSSFIFFISK